MDYQTQLTKMDKNNKLVFHSVMSYAEIESPETIILAMNEFNELKTKEEREAFLSNFIREDQVDDFNNFLDRVMEDKNKKYKVGEWSAIYVFVKSLLDGKFSVMKADLKNKITEYEIIKIFKKDYDNTKELEFKPMLKDQNLLNILDLFLKKLTNSNQTTFEIKEVEEYAENLNFSLNKSSSNQKNDLDAIIKDFHKNNSSRLGYSIKSELSSKATLLNASSHTDFIYKIENIC